ncbi:MAG TPA: tRNA (adenosine(37)-N6)-threonylcarbamoyltransferase complex ATPase subunit type 1 TsaE [Actinomycetota bacterium]|nr:tRNA (adenosine(37)-N6)-threonylcarbamoyltransferase complex ATPase subunit type 1 TsaE [Actinomycetota bacterium]
MTTRSPEETRIVGAALAPTLLPGDVISLAGDLGSGKTVFVQGLATALGAIGRVTSPSFTIVHEYRARYPIVHLDVYRLDSFQEVLDLGFEEFLDPEAILVLEWGDAVEPLLPRSHLKIELTRSADTEREDERLLLFRPRSDEWVRKVFNMMNTAEALLDAAAPDVSSGARFEQAPSARDHRGSPDGSDGDI